MAPRKWIHLINSFEVRTRTSNKKMLTLATDHHSKLVAEDADADILAMLNSFTPVFNPFVAICANYDSVAGIRKGKTLNLETQLGEPLQDALRAWENVVRALYPEDSSQEVEIFPNKRTPFLHGTYEQRINAVNSLISTLQADGNFATLVTQVQSFHNLLVSARDTQQQKEGLVGQLADSRENQRLLVANEMFGNLGRLIHKFRADIVQAERFFDLSLLRSVNGVEEDIPPTTLIVKGKVTNSITGVPVVNIPVLLTVPDSPGPFTVNTDVNGDYVHQIENVPENESGVVTIAINAPGFQPVTQNLNVTTGNSYTLNVELQPL